MGFPPQRRDMSTSKTGPNMVCFLHFGVLSPFWLGNVLRATTACTFSTSQLPKVVRRWCVLYILTWKCASRHNSVQLLISHLTTWLRTRFSEPTFRPSGATNHWKNTVFRDFPTFSRTCIFFLLALSLLWSSLFGSSPLWLFPPLFFHLSILSEVWLLNFLRWYNNSCFPKTCGFLQNKLLGTPSLLMIASCFPIEGPEVQVFLLKHWSKKRCIQASPAMATVENPSNCVSQRP